MRYTRTTTLEARIRRLVVALLSLDRADARHRLPDDQSMDVVSALVRINTLEIRHVPHRRVLGQNPIGAKEAPGLARDIRRRAHVVALGKRDLLRTERPRVLQSAKVKGEELSLHELRQHLRQSLLLDLETGDRLSEHHPIAGVSKRFLVARE